MEDKLHRRILSSNPFHFMWKKKRNSGIDPFVHICQHTTKGVVELQNHLQLHPQTYVPDLAAELNESYSWRSLLRGCFHGAGVMPRDPHIQGKAKPHEQRNFLLLHLPHPIQSWKLGPLQVALEALICSENNQHKDWYINALYQWTGWEHGQCYRDKE